MKTIQIGTEIPGPKSRALMSRREAAVPRGAYHATPVFAAKAEGAVIEDVDGNRFLDFAGGIGSLNVGHRAPRVLAAIRDARAAGVRLLIGRDAPNPAYFSSVPRFHWEMELFVRAGVLPWRPCA